MAIPAAKARRGASRTARPARGGRRAHELRRLGGALLERAEEIVAETVARTATTGEIVEHEVQASFEQVCRNSTPSVARWIAGEDIDVTRGAGRESSQVFGEVAARRAASLQEVTRRSLAWRNVMAEQLTECAHELGTDSRSLAHANTMLQLSLEASLLRMCKCFEDERRRTDEELERRERELAFLATHDSLTGLPNRTLILGRLRQTLARSARSDMPAGLLFIDLDNFKAINDALGHHAGDELLREVAGRLRAVVGEDDALGRLGGDEFVVIAAPESCDESPELLAERVLAALGEPFELSAADAALTVTASVGVASGGRSAEDLLRDADIAMYSAKGEGRNRQATFVREMQRGIQDRMELETDLRAALAGDQLCLHYQPTLRLRDLSVTGTEALMRWRHPTRGLLPPATFVPLLEATGLIADAGRWALREACLQNARWRGDGLRLAVAVNVSARQLDDDGLLADVGDALRASSLPPEALTIEVTESELMRNTRDTAERLAAIRALGVRIAIDDFGTGYSSLANLKRFRADALKIDRSVVSGVAAHSEGDMVIRTLIQLGRALALETHAEGIETENQLQVLRRVGCDGGQGSLFARPLAPADVERAFATLGVRAA